MDIGTNVQDKKENKGVCIIRTLSIEMVPCEDPAIFDRVGPTLTIFLVDEGRENPNNDKSRSSSAHQLCDFLGGWGLDLLPPSGATHESFKHTRSSLMQT